jgi:hypothetical protein
MKLLRFLGLTSLILISFSFAPPQFENYHIKVQESWKVLNKSGYTIQYPGDWDLNESGQMGTSFIILSKQTSQSDKFRENINLIIQDLTGQNIDLDKYTEISLTQIKTLITNSNLLESKRKVSNGLNYQKVIYTGDQGIFRLKFEQYFWIKNKKAFILTFTSEISQFENYKEVGEKILNSFVFDKN